MDHLQAQSEIDDDTGMPQEVIESFRKTTVAIPYNMQLS